MKKVFLSRRNALINEPRTITGFILGALFALLLVLRFVFPGAFLALVSPLLAAGNSATSAAASLTVLAASKVDLARERDMLVTENAALTVQNEKLAAQIADLEKLLGPAPKEQNGIPSGVLARPPVAGYDVLILAAGSKDGVVAGMHAFGEGGVPLGVVESATAASSRVGLFSASGTETNVWIGNARTPSVVTGEGGGSFNASVPKDAPVAVGDLVYFAYGGALPIGSVRAIDKNTSTSEETLYIEGMVNPFSITWVELLP